MRRIPKGYRAGVRVAGYADGGAAGRRTANSVRPGRDVTSTVPPWASTIDWTMDKPNPLVPSEVGAALAVPCPRPPRAGTPTAPEAAP